MAPMLLFLMPVRVLRVQEPKAWSITRSYLVPVVLSLYLRTQHSRILICSISVLLPGPLTAFLSFSAASVMTRSRYDVRSVGRS